MPTLQSALDEIGAGNNGPFAAYLRSLGSPSPVVAPLLITTTPFVMEATGDVHRVYALALAAPAAVAIVQLPADPVDGAIVTLKGDYDDLDSTPITVSAVGGEAIDAGGFTSYGMPSGPLSGGEYASQAKTFVYYDALGAWRVVWSDPGQLIPSPLRAR